jgi:tRNA G10  N-methylase Trm11
MSVYYCHLGNTPELSLYELTLLVPTAVPTLVLPTIASIELDDDQSAQDLMAKAGGLVKIYRYLQTIDSPEEKKITGAIVEHLKTDFSNKVTFGISTIGGATIEIDPAEVKIALKKENVASRYVESESPYGVAAAIVLKKNIHEIVLITVEDQVHLAETVAVQDINDWTKRDRNKPYADRKKGMLPPKVARIMVNIGLGLLPPETNIGASMLYDPFCGSGGVLIEGLMRNINVYGSDIDIQAVMGTRENLEWLKQEYQFKQSFAVVQRDATQRFQPNNKPWVDAIVTEPFLGKPTPKEHELPNIFRGLQRLYLGAFKNWTYSLKNGAPVVIVFPLVVTQNHRFSLESLIDKLQDLGYTSVSQPVVYSRPQAIIQRQIHFFRFKQR